MMIVYVLKNLINNMSTLIVIAYLISRIDAFKKFVLGKRNSLKDKLIMAVIFGFMGILATYTGVSVKGAIANSRIIGVFVGGIFGGPIVGLGAGLIAGFHRWAIDIGGFTAVACSLSTIVEGLIGGMASKYIKNKKNNWIHALILGVLSEILQMIIIIIIAKPYEAAVELVKIIWVPMVLFNPIGIAVFVALIDGIYKDQEKEAAIQTQLALNIAEKCLPYLRKGLTDVTEIQHVAGIILKMADVEAVAITDKEKILAHAGIGEDHHRSGDRILTNFTKEVIESGNMAIAKIKEDIGCKDETCKLKSAVIVPLLKKREVIGALKLYKNIEYGISDVDIILAQGLAKLFSTQLELAEMDYQIKLREKAELKALQSQINPHFLFNAINTIVSFCRIDIDKAKQLLINLGDYFRNTLSNNEDYVGIETELNHVNAYLAIEKARFDEKLKIEVDVDKKVDCLLPQLILQPIVENAIKHGLIPKKDGGTIIIKAEKINSETHITVEDSGVGIDEEIIEQLYNNKLQEGKIGLSNVHNRLKSIYGQEYGLKIFNREEGGTKVEIIIPNRIAGDIL